MRYQLSFVALALVAAQAADLVSTLAGLRHGGIEQNQIALWTLHHGGVPALVILKAGSTIVLLAVWLLAYRSFRLSTIWPVIQTGIVILLLAYCVVTFHNLIIALH